MHRAIFIILIPIFLETFLYSEDPCDVQAESVVDKIKEPLTEKRRGRRKKDIPDFSIFVQEIKRHGIENKKDYERRRSELNLPSNPSRAYKGQWSGWPKLLERENMRGKSVYKKIVTYEQAAILCRNAGITSFQQYRRWYKSQGNLPASPETYRPYIEKWQGWDVFLGKKVRKAS